LSGGQMFQASLSLALALSESIQAFAGTEQNFFFLDEGFGTQDKESLRLVFESLKELRKENRVVGLISHVDELQEEIDVCLKVRNDDEIGSLVELVG
jgi:exonuclease SbcC